MRSRIAASVMTVGLLLALAGTAAGASGWSLTRSPSSVDEDEQRVFTLRATDTDGSGDIGCVIVVVPSAFTVQDSDVVDTSVGGPWRTTESNASGGKRVRVFEPGGGYKLKENDWVEFTITVTGRTPGSHTWTGNVTQGEDCNGPFLPQINLSVAVQAAPPPPPPPPPTPAPTPTVTPTPTPAPTPTATPTPTPRPTRTPTPTARPTQTANPTPAPTPTGPAPTSSAAVNPSPTLTAPTAATPTPSASPSEQAVTVVPSPSSPGTGTTTTSPAPRPQTRREGSLTGPENGDAGVTLKLGAIEASPFGALTLLGDGFAWFVPAFVAGVPGILILLIVLLQLAGGVIWAPAVRRFRDQSGQPTRRSTQSS